MARQKKQGIDYFSLDCDFFSDKKIKILKARYGADGITIYLYLLCEIYRNGYYIIVDDDFYYIVSDDLNMNCDKLKQVLTFLLERSMFDKQLFQSDAVLTSAGIQRRFQLAVKTRAKKNPIEVERFWLLKKEETEPFIKVTLFNGNSEKKENNSKKNNDNSQEKSLKESKVNNKYIYFNNPELEKTFHLYISMRNQNQKYPLMPEQIEELKEELHSLGNTDEERILICKTAFIRGWKGFYPLNKQKNNSNSKASSSKGKKKSNNNSFHNFEQRDYDYAALEEKLTGTDK
mgnify:CR=1 FL=1